MEELFIKESYRINNEIRSATVRLIDENGNSLGIKDLSFAKRYAEEQGLDLVEIAPQANPPVCKILDYRKFKYELNKKSKEAKKKQKIVELKEIWLRANISSHDLNFKLNHIKEFLTKRKKVKVTMKFKGRESSHREIGYKLMEDVIEQCKDLGNVESKPKNEGRNIILVLTPKV